MKHILSILAILLIVPASFATTYTCVSDNPYEGWVQGYNPNIEESCALAKQYGESAYRNCIESKKMMDSVVDAKALYDKGMCYEEKNIKTNYASGNCSVIYINKDGKKLYTGYQSYNLENTDVTSCVNKLKSQYNIINK